MTNGYLHIGVFTRINVGVGLLVYSLLPLWASWSAIRSGQLDSNGLTVLLVEVTALQALLFFAVRRCSSEQLPFWRGVLFTAASMRTGWVYLDMAIAGAAVTLLLLVAGCLVFTPNPAHLYHRLVYSFYTNRMEQ